MDVVASAPLKVLQFKERRVDSYGLIERIDFGLLAAERFAHIGGISSPDVRADCSHTRAEADVIKMDRTCPV